ncbi:MAG: replicative DNA helicase [Minisyncoccia bacterium]
MATKSVRVPPQNLDAERALLGAIMLKPNAMYEIADSVSPESFYASKHGFIFDAMRALFEKGEPIDLVTLSGKLKEQQRLDSVGGSSYLSELVGAAPAAGNVIYYADIVKEKSVRRNIIDAASHIGEIGYHEDIDVEEVVDEAQQKIFEIANTSSTNKVISMHDAVIDAKERLGKLQEGGERHRGVPTGYPGLDDLLSGLQNSDLIILAARPSMGKTTLALDIGRQAAVKHKIPVAIFSLEMSSQQLTDRMLSAEAKIKAWELRTGRIRRDEDFDAIAEAIDRLKEAPLYIDDRAHSTVLQMRSTARRLKSEKNLGLIIIDYLQLITPSGSHKSDNLVQQVTEISRALKGLAREINVPVLALSQLSRAVEQRRDKPRLSDLRDSGSIEQDADVVMFIHRDDKMNENSDRPNIADIMIEKHRNGPIGKVELYFNGDSTTFVNIEKSNFSDFAPTPSPMQGAEDSW